MVNWRFQKGDRVKRPADPFAKVWYICYGTVVARYSVYGVRHGDGPMCHYPELYMVEWDDGTFGSAYLQHGIDPIDYQYRNVRVREPRRRNGSVAAAQ